MGKRKRNATDDAHNSGSKASENKKKPAAQGVKADQQNGSAHGPICIQIITGSYNRVLHGLTATINHEDLKNSDDATAEDKVSFADTFLLSSHTSAIKCLAVSPLSTEKTSSAASSKLFLASGGTDERINLYSISAVAPSEANSVQKPTNPSLHSVAKLENAKNRELGSLLHHSSAISKLVFATKSKLLSASTDNTISVSRTRDWTVLSTLKAPVPQAHGRPSGDTAAVGQTPSGINDFDFDPSMRIMISVGRGERCMRLWNLVTGKKAGALNFPKALLQSIGESKFHAGEGRTVLFSPDGSGFVIGFERSAVVFDMQSQVQGVVTPSPRTKIHQMKFVPGVGAAILAISTEDGRLIFFDFSAPATKSASPAENEFPEYRQLAQLGGPAAGVTGRIKDFEILTIDGDPSRLVVVTAGSDGALRLWVLMQGDLLPSSETSNGHNGLDNEVSKEALASNQVGQLLARFETGDRITCMKAFIMLSADTNGISDRKAEGSDEKDDFEGFD